MRPISVRLSAAGVTPWIPLNRVAQNFKVGLAVILSSGASMTYSVQHTLDDITTKDQAFSLTRVTTAATGKRTNHGMSVADWVCFEGVGAPFDGEFAVASITDANTFTYTVLDSGLTVNSVGWMHLPGRVLLHETLVALTASADGNYNYPPVATRLKITTYGSGFADFLVIQGRG